MAAEGLAARHAALALLTGVTEAGRRLSELLPDALAALPPEDRARAQRLAVDTLRWMDRADRLLGPHLRLKPWEVVLNVLRMAVVEQAVHGAAAHGVVDGAVRAMKADPATARYAGLVNAVLRRVDLSRWDALPPPRLPKKLRAALVRAWGKETVGRIEAAHLAGAPLDLTARGDAAALADRVGGRLLPTGSVRLTAAAQVSALPSFADGAFWVQDAAAALPARVLDVGLGETVLDLCAAPGGKTMQLAAAGAAVTAVDMSEDRLTRLNDNLARTGLTARVVVADLLEWRPDTPVDAILLDAPCSATGTIRRHPDLPRVFDIASLPDLTGVQGRMLDRAADWLRPGGRLVFCTCSLLLEEGEAQVARLLARRSDLSIDRDALRLPGLDPDWIGAEGLRLRPDYWPDRGGMDGFFVAALRRAG